MTNNNIHDIGINIRKWRIIRGYEQKEFADLLDVATSTLSKWENGHSKLNLVRLQKIAVCLKISIPQLLSDPNDLLPTAMINNN